MIVIARSTIAARSWNRYLPWLALSVVIAGSFPANVQGLTDTGSQELATMIESRGGESEADVLAQAIEPVLNPALVEGDQSVLDGVVRFEPPTDDEIGETGSGATRSNCAGTFALLPIGDIDPSAVQMFPPQRINQSRVDRLDLFVYVSPIATIEGNSPKTLRLLDLGLIERDANLEPFHEDTDAASQSRRLVPVTKGGYILRVSLAADSTLEASDHQLDWFVTPCSNSNEFGFGQFGALHPLEVPILLEATTIPERIQQAAALAQAGLWLDTLVTLDDARRLAMTPAEMALVEANWMSLFESIGWDFATYPIAGLPVLTIEELEAQAEGNRDNEGENIP
ncbi:MAG: DUF928 domain-containing protein [Coleofasciculaceae cyanobacterium RL_1_1]|nr:DUF928 domain-containing protein [Coleofasciculaceae cyanobacterium RL_1_1]